MASNALVTTRINENIKHEATEVLATMGLTVSDAVRLLLTKVAKEKALPFEIWQPNRKFRFYSNGVKHWNWCRSTTTTSNSCYRRYCIFYNFNFVCIAYFISMGAWL